MPPSWKAPMRPPMRPPMNGTCEYAAAPRAAVPGLLEAANAAPPTTRPIATTAIPAPINHFFMLARPPSRDPSGGRVALWTERLPAAFEGSVKGVRRPPEGSSVDPPWTGDANRGRLGKKAWAGDRTCSLAAPATEVPGTCRDPESSGRQLPP